MEGGERIIDCHGLRLPVDPGRMSPRLIRRIEAGRHQAAEAGALRAVLRPGDRVLVLGAGNAVLAALAAQVPHTHVTLAEPEAAGRAAAGRLLALNGLQADLIAAADLAAGLAGLCPDVLVCDGDGAGPGGLAGALAGADLEGLRAAVLRFHPRRQGRDGIALVSGALAAQGLYPPPGTDPLAEVQVFARTDALPHPFAPRRFRRVPATDPRVFVAICMKNEGPFLLEWLAWHKALGVTDIVAFTNHCSDGTDRMLDRLDEMGHLRHLPNPALATGERAYQPVALTYAHLLREMQRADLFLSMDTDEFVNIRAGDGTMAALVQAAGPFDVLSMTEINHGANGRAQFETGWQTDLFPGHQPQAPGAHKARRGVKSLTRLSPRVVSLRNHRPQMRGDLGALLWRDGSGRVTHHFADDRTQNGHDCRGTYDLVRLEHFPLRSLETFLAKMFRGDAVVEGKRVTQTYWRQRNHATEDSTAWAAQQARAKAWFRDHLAGDAALMALQDEAFRAHRALIARLLDDPEFRERRDWALREAWEAGPDPLADPPGSPGADPLRSLRADLGADPQGSPGTSR